MHFNFVKKHTGPGIGGDLGKHLKKQVFFDQWFFSTSRLFEREQVTCTSMPSLGTCRLRAGTRGFKRMSRLQANLAVHGAGGEALA